MVRRVEILSALLASVIGLTWLVALIHLLRLLSEAGDLMGAGSSLLAPPMGWPMFWLYCAAMAIVNISVAVGAYLHLRGMPTPGQLLLWISTTLLVVGVVFYHVVPDLFVPYGALATYHDSFMLISVPGAFLAGIAAVAAITPPTLRWGSPPERSREDEQPAPGVLRPNHL